MRKGSWLADCGLTALEHANSPVRPLVAVANQAGRHMARLIDKKDYLLTLSPKCLATRCRNGIFLFLIISTGDSEVGFGGVVIRSLALIDNRKEGAEPGLLFDVRRLSRFVKSATVSQELAFKGGRSLATA